MKNECPVVPIMFVILILLSGGNLIYNICSPKPIERLIMYRDQSLNEIPGVKAVEVNSNWSFMLGDYDGDGILDLWIIKQAGTGTHSTEVHVLKGPTFQQFILHCGTPLEETPNNVRIIDNRKVEKE